MAAGEPTLGKEPNSSFVIIHVYKMELELDGDQPIVAERVFVVHWIQRHGFLLLHFLSCYMCCVLCVVLPLHVPCAVCLFYTCFVLHV